MGDYLEEYLKKENESIVRLWDKIIDKQVDFSNELLDITIQNNIKSYESLIEEKKETLTQFTTQLIDILYNVDDEFDVKTPPKNLKEKQKEDIEKFKKEIQISMELHDALMDNSTDKVPKRVFKNLQNI